MYLMNNDIPVLQFNIDKNEYKILREDLLPIQLRGAFIAAPALTSALTPENVNEVIQINGKNRNALIHYLATRILSLDRENAKKLLNA